MVNYRKLFLYSTLMSWGEVPHPRATIPQMEFAIRAKLIQIGRGSVLDPEVPDSLLGLLIPAMIVRGVEPEEIANVATSMTHLGTPGSGAAGATLSTTISSAENETLLENLGDIGSNILSLDLGGTVGAIGDSIMDFFSGGGIW